MFLSIPTIYCGKTWPDKRKIMVPLRCSTICKWELRYVDRRRAMCIPIFFQNEEASDQFSTGQGYAISSKMQVAGKEIHSS